MPVFAELFGIRPWELDLLTLADFEVLERYVAARAKAMEESGRG